MIKEIIIKCDEKDEQTQAHETWLEERINILSMLRDMMATAPNESIRDKLKDIYLFIMRGEM